MARYLKPELLIVDDMGMKHLPKQAGECLFEIILRRYETRSTIMTSNRPLEEWGKLIGDVPAATAILDRFLHRAEIIAINGRSYRLRNQGGKDGQPAENDQPSKEKEGKRSRRESAESPSAEQKGTCQHRRTISYKSINTTGWFPKRLPAAGFPKPPSDTCGEG